MERISKHNTIMGMQNIVQFFKDNPNKKKEFDEAGEKFNQKWYNNFLTINQEHINKNENLEFPDKWSDFKVNLENLKIDTLRISRCFICGKDLNDANTVEHYRPKGSKDKDEKKLYWWLAYDYKNYYFCCKDCNSKKSVSFPLQDKSPQVTIPAQSIDEEKPLLINPMYDDPSEYFKVALVQHPQAIYNEKVIIILPKDNLDKDLDKYNRAITTIKTFNLDLNYLEFIEQQELGKKSSLTSLQNNSQTTKRRIETCRFFYQETVLKQLIEKYPNEESKDVTSFKDCWNQLVLENKSISDWGLAQLIYNFQFQDYTKI